MRYLYYIVPFGSRFARGPVKRNPLAKLEIRVLYELGLLVLKLSDVNGGL